MKAVSLLEKLVATPNQLILGDRTAENRTAQKDLFLGKAARLPNCPFWLVVCPF
jgi:predicted LPLAT superfamily acyltransferase